MRIIMILVCILGAYTGLVAQPNNVVTAHNYLNDYQSSQNTSDLLNAREYIEKAAVHEKTISHPKTWFYRGNIFLAMAESKDPAVKAAAPNALTEAYNSYIKSLSLDEKEAYSEVIENTLAKMITVFINHGVDAYNAKDYSASLGLFEKSVELNKRFNRIDTIGLYNAALSAEKGGNFSKAIEYYDACIKADYGGAGVYSFIAQLHREQKDTAQAVTVIQAGRKAYPADKNLIIEELNFYLLQGKNKEAVENLNLAIQADPQNHILYSSLGVVYDNMGNADGVGAAESEVFLKKSEEAYKKALEIKPDYIDALFNLGALHINQGVKITEKANTITDHVIYAKEIKKADEHFKIAMPYLEKALELNPSDPAMRKNTLLSLKQLYARMGMDEKYKTVNDQLNN